MVVECKKLDHFGRGIVFVNDKITFVRGLLPMETAEVKITVDKKKYAEGELVKLIKTSCDRVIPNCPYENCGCAIKHLKYEKQLRYKEEKVKEIVYKFGHIKPIFRNIIYDDHISGYRNKITLKVDNSVGYYEFNTNKFLKIDNCFLVDEKINKILKVLNTLDLSMAYEVIIKEFDQIMIVIKGKIDFEPLKEFADIIYVDDKLVYGDEFASVMIKDFSFKISKDSFFQVNKYLTEKLYDTALNYCGKDKSKKVLDLYCGTGTLTLLLSKYFDFVTGIEINKEAVLCALENKKINKVNNVKFICGDVSKEIDKLNADIIVVDPPRSGLSKEGRDDIIRIDPSKIVYISCDPITLARDLNVFSEKYEVIEITPVDMFPNTYHVETVTLLERK